jgi:hypothetical protein
MEALPFVKTNDLVKNILDDYCFFCFYKSYNHDLYILHLAILQLSLF